MTTLVLLAAAALLAWLAWWWYIGRNRPVMPPLALDEDDVLMIEAREQARASIPRMLQLFAGAQEHTRVKVPFASNGGETEHLWADLLSVDGERIQVRYITPPVTHTGQLDRLQTHALSDIEDWVITKDPQRYVGGYSVRAMFQRGREQWGDLPPTLKAEEAKYG